MGFDSYSCPCGMLGSCWNIRCGLSVFTGQENMGIDDAWYLYGHRSAIRLYC